MSYLPSSNPFIEGSKQVHPNSLTNELPPFLHSILRKEAILRPYSLTNRFIDGSKQVYTQITSPVSCLPSSNLLIERGKQFPNPHSLTNVLPLFSNPFIEGRMQFQNKKNSSPISYLPSLNLLIERGNPHSLANELPPILQSHH